MPRGKTEFASMPVFAMFLPFLAAVAQQTGAPITVKAYPWAPFISPMGEPFRSHSADDDPFVRWFRQADRNSDGFLTADEMSRDAVRFFERLDEDHDGKLGSEEVVAYETDIAPEVQVNSSWKRTRKDAAAEPMSDGERRDRRRRGDSVDGYHPDGLQGAARYGLLNIPEPVTGADLDLNGTVTIDEFRRSAVYRFQLLDTQRQGRLTMRELESRIPSRPDAKRRAKNRSDAVDTRIGIPLPGGN
jgi:Ca2+-binding EF-hand superfamily protein